MLLEARLLFCKHIHMQMSEGGGWDSRWAHSGAAGSSLTCALLSPWLLVKAVNMGDSGGPMRRF